MESVELTEYIHTGLSGEVYHPVFENGRWSIGFLSPVSIYDIAYLCEIPDDEVLLLKLKYGG